MKTKTININGNSYEFVNQYGSHRNGFSHITTLLKNGIKVAYNKVNYYNRTWENYEFATSMRGAIEIYINSRYEYLKQEYKDINNIKRFTKETKIVLLELEQLKEEIR